MATKQQTKILDYIQSYKNTEGNYPTLIQIQKYLELNSVSTVHSHLNKLIESGQIKKRSNGSGYELAVANSLESEFVPLLGYITAGLPIEAIEDTHPPMLQVKKIPSRGEFYALKVKGDSMIEEGIYDGDTVIIKRQNDAYDGQTIVAIIDNNQATLKKIYREKNRVRLQPANQTIMPIFREDVEVRGIVWDIIRQNDSQTVVHASDSNKKSKPLKIYNTIDLFAGVGGIRIGFEKTGKFRTVFANDFDKACKVTYDLNFTDKPMVLEDINNINPQDLPKFDFLLGGFPCQAFSIAGYRKGFLDDKGRGNLFFKIAEILENREPMGFLLENVKNLKTHDGGKTFQVIKDTLENKLGYHIKTKVLNSMEYGNIPQNRERIYIVGFKDKSMCDKFNFPDPLVLSRSVTDLLDEQVDAKYYYNDKPLFTRLKDEVNETGQVYQWRRQYVRKNKKGVCPTLTANMGMGGHNVPIIFDGKGIRKLTPRECFRLQGFDDTYKLPDIADSALYKQAGNSVTVPVLERIANQIRQVC